MIRDCDLAWDEFSQQRLRLIKEGKEVCTWFAGRHVEPDEPIYKFEPKKDRDEYDAMREAIHDLKRLMRFERRAWGRQKRAITLFTATKVMQRLVSPNHDLSSKRLDKRLEETRSS